MLEYRVFFESIYAGTQDEPEHMDLIARNETEAAFAAGMILGSADLDYNLVKVEVIKEEI